jgi:hypothetical protein
VTRQEMTEALVSALRQRLAGGDLDVPEPGIILWNIFIALGATRTYHSAGPNQISYTEIDAYCRLHRWPLEPHHVDIIVALDAAWLEHAQRELRRPSGMARLRGGATKANIDAVLG